MSKKITLWGKKSCMLTEIVDSLFEGKNVSVISYPSVLLLCVLWVFLKFYSRFSVSSQNWFLSGYYLQTAK